MSAPTEPTHPPVPGHELPPATDAVSSTSADKLDSAAAGVPSRRGGRGRSRRQHGGERPPKKKKVETPPETPKDPVLEQARLVYEEATANMNDILYNPAIERRAAEGDGMEEIPEEEQSYKAKRRAYTESKLDFSYDVEPPSADEYRKAKDHKKSKGKRASEHRPHIKIEQTADDHSIARKNIIYLTTDVFAADMARINVEIAAAKVKADSAGKGADVLQVVRDTKDSPSLEAWLNSRKVQLEWLRVDVIRDSADWFDVRVDQVETMMHEITKRTDKPSSVDKRLEALTTHQEFLEQEENLREDIKMFEGFLELPLAPGAEQTRNVVRRIVEDAKRKLVKYEAQKSNLLKLKVRSRWDKEKEELVVDEENGNNPVENARAGIMRDMLDRPIAEKFAKEAEKRLVGLSPEEELNFWKSLRELFGEVEPEVEKGLKFADKRNARQRRLDRLNGILGLYTSDQGQDFLVKIDDRTNPKEALPYGFGQIVERCRAEAKLLGELKDELFFLMVKMGYETRRATQTALRGHSNTEKIEATQRLNQLADKTRAQAFTQLQEIKKETPDMDDAAKAALAEANAAAVAFKTELAGRGVRDLKWNRKEEGKKEADRPLLIKLRQKMLELINLGTLSDIDIAELQDILFPEPAAEAGKAEKGEEVTTPLFERIKSGDLPTEWFTKVGVTAEQLKDMVVDLDGRLGKALQSGVVYETMVKQFTMLQPKELNVTTVQQFADTLEFIVKTCEQMKEAIGQDWCNQFGLRQVDERTGKRGVANSDYIVRMLGEMETSVGSTEALLRAGGDTAMTAALVKVGAGEVIIPDEKKDFVTNQLIDAIANNKFKEVNAEMVQTWLVEAAVVEPEEGVVGDNVLSKILDGQIQATSADDQDGIAYISRVVELMRQDSSSTVLISAIIDNFHFTSITGTTPTEQITNTSKIVSSLFAVFNQMKREFGENWAQDVGLLVQSTEETEPQVDQALLQSCLEVMSKTDNIMNAFAFDTMSVAQEKLYGKLDPAVRDRFTTLEIPVPDQLYFALMTISTAHDADLPEPNVALRRLIKCIELGARKKRGAELLQHLRLKEGDNYGNSEILDIIQDSSFD